jgi:hypothetical protein
MTRKRQIGILISDLRAGFAADLFVYVCYRYF